jgi:hypothetical protein
MGAGILELAAGICALAGLMALSFALTGVLTSRKKAQEQAGALEHR